MTRSALCPACTAERSTPVFSAREMFGGETFEVRACDVCSLRFTNDELTPEQLASYYHYEGGADAGERFRGPLEPLMRAIRRARTATLIADHPRPGRFLDVGCGRGVTLTAMTERGWDAYGVEIDEDVATTARRAHGDHIFVGGIQSVPRDVEPFDVISFWHVLEHLDDPFESLARAAELLAVDGTIVVGVPNADSWQAKAFGSSWLHLDVPRHRFHFSEETLERLVQRVGLTITSSEHFSLEYGPYGVFQSALARAGLGHELFTRVLRSTRRAAPWREPAFWKHLALSAPIAALLPASFVAEVLASAVGRGGCIVVRVRAG